MADQVEIRIPKTVINEGSQFIATANFRTRASAAASTPTTAEYKITNLSSNTVVQDWTSLSAAAEISITLAASLNEIDDETTVSERRELLVAADRGLSTQVIGKVEYVVKNLSGYG